MNNYQWLELPISRTNFHGPDSQNSSYSESTYVKLLKIIPRFLLANATFFAEWSLNNNFSSKICPEPVLVFIFWPETDNFPS